MIEKHQVLCQPMSISVSTLCLPYIDVRKYIMLPLCFLEAVLYKLDVRK